MAQVRLLTSRVRTSANIMATVRQAVRSTSFLPGDAGSSTDLPSTFWYWATR